jgi:hypothetical protein
MDTAIGAIAFDSGAPPPFKFLLPPGSSVSRVSGNLKTDARPGAIVQILGSPAKVVTLTNFKATRLPGAGNQPLDISFAHTFKKPNVAKIAVADAIQGDFLNTVAGMNVFGDHVTWQGLVDNVPISPPQATVDSPAPPGVRQHPVFGGHAPTQFPGMADVTLVGQLNITLGGPNHELSLPDSAEVGFSKVPEPLLSSVHFGLSAFLALLTLGLTLVYVRGKRERDILE